MPSRVADNLFWLGRYAERLEDTVRLLRCVLVRLAGEVGTRGNSELAGLIGLLVNLDLFPPKFRERHTAARGRARDLSSDLPTTSPGHRARKCSPAAHLAFSVRDRFSADTWRILNKLQMDARQRSGRAARNHEPRPCSMTLVVDLAAFSGMEMENMTRGHGWRFLDIGRRLERAANIITRCIQGGLAAEPAVSNALETVLEIADSVMTYRRRYFAQPQWPAVLDLLLTDEGNPRSLAFQVDALADHATNLPREAASRGRGPDMRQIRCAARPARRFEPRHHHGVAPGRA